MKKKRIISLILATTMAATVVVSGCGKSGDSEKTDDGKKKTEASDDKVLEFYHGYYQDASEWAPAQVMRDIYDEFAKEHADGEVEFKAIPTEDIDSVVENKVAGGSYPDMVDLAGRSVSLAAISQDLLLDKKPYIDEEGIKDNVGINYTQNDVDGKIYTVHDQLLTMGYWYNDKVLKDAGATTPDTWKNWSDFEGAMEKVRSAGGDVYAYGAGQGSTRCFNAILGMSENGRKIVGEPLTEEAIESKEFEEAFKQVANMDQKNGSSNASSNADDGANDWAADFNKGQSAVFFNGVWAAGGFEDTTNFKPAIFPGSVSLSSASLISFAAVIPPLAEDKETLPGKIAGLKFVKYMTSDEVQTKIFKEVGANPCTTTLDLNALAEGSDEKTKLLAEACSQANDAEYVIATIDSTWGTDIANAIGNKLIESTVSGTDVNAKFEELKSELIGLIG